MSGFPSNFKISTEIQSASYDAIWAALLGNSLTDLEAALEKDPSAINMMGTGYFEGETPLIFSANTGRTSFARLLLRYGAEITWRNKQGKTALDIAREKDFEDITTELAHYQKKIDEKGPSVKARQWTIEIISATNVKAADRGKTSDPYVYCYWDNQTKNKHKTNVVKKTVAPQWKEKFEMEPPDAETKELVMDMFDWDRVGTHEFLGRAVLPLDALAKFYPGPLEYTQPLAPRSNKDKKVSGSIRFCVHTTFTEKIQPQLHFSHSLVDSINQAQQDGQIHVVDRCLEFLYSDAALRTEGIIRIPGSKPDIYRLKDKIDEGKNVSFDHEDPMDVAGLLKLYLYCLPDSLFPRSAWNVASKIDLESSELITKLRQVIKDIKEPHFTVLKKVTQYFVKLASYAPVNKMDPRAISISIGPSVLVHPDIREDHRSFVEATKIVPPLMQNMILYHNAIFNDGELVQDSIAPPVGLLPPSEAPPPLSFMPPPTDCAPPPTDCAPPPSDCVPPPPGMAPPIIDGISTTSDSASTTSTDTTTESETSKAEEVPPGTL